MIFYWILGIFLALWQGASNFFLWPAGVVVLAAGRKEGQDVVYLLAFVTGLIVDLATGRSLGQTAIEMLVLSGLIYLFKSRFEFNWRWMLVFLVFSQSLYHFIG